MLIMGYRNSNIDYNNLKTEIQLSWVRATGESARMEGCKLEDAISFLPRFYIRLGIPATGGGRLHSSEN